MKPKDKSKANFLYSKPLRAKKLDLFCHNNIRIDDNLDICDQISSILDDGDTTHKASDTNLDVCDYVSTADEQNTTFNVEECMYRSENIVGGTEDSAASTSCNNNPERSAENEKDRTQKPENRGCDTQKTDDASRSNETQRFSYKLPTLKNLFQPPYVIRKPSFLTRSTDSKGDDGSRYAECSSNEEFEKKILSQLPRIVQKLCDENANFKLLNQNQEIEIERLVAKREGLCKRVEECEAEKGNIMAELKKLNSDYSKLLDDMEQNDAYKKEIESYLVILKEEHENMRSKQSEMSESNKKLQEEKSVLETRILKCEKESALAAEKNSELETAIATYTTRTAILEQEKLHLESRTNAFEKEFSDALSRCKSKLKVINDRVNTFGCESAKRAAAIKRLVCENNQTAVSIAEIKEEVKMQREDNVILRKRLEISTCKSKRAVFLMDDIANEIVLARECFTGLNGGFMKLRSIHEEREATLSLAKRRSTRLSSLLILAKDKLKDQIAPELKSAQQQMKQIKKCVQKAWSREVLERTHMKETHNNEMQKLKGHYTAKIRKIYRHYKEKRQNAMKIQEEPDDEDVWNVFQ